MKLVEDCGDIYNELVGSALMGPELFKILSSPQLVDIAECIVGPEVHCEGRHRLRPKLPHYGVADYRWHEDTLYQARRLTYVQRQYGLGPADARQSDVYLSRIVAAPQMAEPGFWIPLVDVDASNGCLSLLPGGHHHTAVYDSQWRSGDFVPELDGLKTGADADAGRRRAVDPPAPAARFAAKSLEGRQVERRHSLSGRTPEGEVGARAGVPGAQQGAPPRRSEHPRGICAHSDGGKGLRPGDGNQLLSIAWTTTPRMN